MIDALVFLLTVLLAYIYVGYPLLLGLFARCFPKPHRTDDGLEPSVTLIISARNEQGVIRRKIENSLAIDYPRARLSIVVVSDKSTDETDAIVEEFQDRGVRLLRTPERRGKTSGLNKAMSMVQSDVVVFSDANAMYHRSALKHLVRHFVDPRVGYVVGLAKYEITTPSAAESSEETYWNLETQIKRWESSLSSVVGADGAIYAIRRELYEPLDESDINDFVNPLQIVAKGYRGVYDDKALCFEHVAGEFRREFGRKVRIANRSFNGFLRVPAAVNPFKVGWFAWQLVSHKLLRWFSPYFLLVHFLLCVMSVKEGLAGTLSNLFIWLYGILAVLGLLGWIQDRRGGSATSALYLPYYFWLMNLASAVGVWIRIRGKTISVWETVRQSTLFRNEAAGLLPLMLLTVLGVAAGRILWWNGYGKTVAVSAAHLMGFALVYTYVGYPLVLTLVSRVFRVHVERDETHLPMVTLLITAYNEADVIEEKILNSLNLDYPKDRIKIVIVSDGSTDGTEDIVRGYAHRGVFLHAFAPNRGKIAALNEAMVDVDTEVVLFSDANVMYDAQVVRKLVRNFKDPRVGAVSGRVLLLSDGVSYGPAEERYYRIEHYVQAKEGETGAMVGADGAMYAIRRRFFRSPPTDTILDDFVIPMEIASQGLWVVHDSEAVGTERNVNEVRDEFRRKARIIAGGVQCLLSGCGLPKASQPFLWFKFLSHKVLRWASGALILLFIGILVALYLAGTGEDIGLKILLYVILLSLVLAVAGQLFPRLRAARLINFSHYFYMLNLASLVGCYRGLTGRQRVAWRAP